VAVGKNEVGLGNHAHRQAVFIQDESRLAACGHPFHHGEEAVFSPEGKADRSHHLADVEYVGHGAGPVLPFRPEGVEFAFVTVTVQQPDDVRIGQDADSLPGRVSQDVETADLALPHDVQRSVQ